MHVHNLLPLARAKLTSTPGPWLLLLLCLGCSSSKLSALDLPLSFCSLLTCHLLGDPPLRCSPLEHSLSYHLALSLHHIYCSLEPAFSVLRFLALMFVFCLKQTAVLRRTSYTVSTRKHSLRRVSMWPHWLQILRAEALHRCGHSRARGWAAQPSRENVTPQQSAESVISWQISSELCIYEVFLPGPLLAMPKESVMAYSWGCLVSSKYPPNIS